MPLPLSILDLAFIGLGETAADALILALGGATVAERLAAVDLVAEVWRNA